MISCERLNDVLCDNGYLGKGQRIYIPGCVEDFALGAYEDCINNVARLAEYIINNGADDKTSVKTLKSAVKTAGDILKLKSNDASGGKFASVKKAVAEQGAACPQNISGIGISDYAKDCATSCSDGVAALLKDAESVDEEEFELINDEYLQRSAHKDYDKWQKETKTALDKMKKTVKEIAETLDDVVDNSSTQALDDCREVVARLAKWREDSVLCYFAFEDSMQATLDGALASAKKWAARNTGVSKKSPKAEQSALGPIMKWKKDQMQKYIAASKRQ